MHKLWLDPCLKKWERKGKITTSGLVFYQTTGNHGAHLENQNNNNNWGDSWAYVLNIPTVDSPGDHIIWERKKKGHIVTLS